MQAYPSREEDLDQLCRTIRGKLEHLPDPETEALLKMLEKPPFEDEAGRIIRELDGKEIFTGNGMADLSFEKYIGMLEESLEKHLR